MNRETQNKIDDALFNFYLEADRDMINDCLGENLQHLEEYTKKKKRMLFMARAEANKRHNEHLLQLVSKFQDALTLNIEKPITILKHIIQSNPSLALYRNLTNLSKENIIEIIKDKNLIELIEKLENDETKH